MSLHLSRLKKEDNEDHFENNYLLCNEYPGHWAILCDKGYQGAVDSIRAITPKKKPARGLLSHDDDVLTRNFLLTGF